MNLEDIKVRACHAQSCPVDPVPPSAHGRQWRLTGQSNGLRSSKDLIVRYFDPNEIEQALMVVFLWFFPMLCPNDGI